jgi:hypothetical protein
MKFYFGDQIKEDEMSRACSTYDEEQKCIRGFGGNSLMERDILIKCILRIGWAGLIWFTTGTGRLLYMRY